MADKIKLTDLIAQADKKKAQGKKRADIYVKSLEGLITIEQPDRALCLDALDKDEKGDDYLVYECVIEPSLKDKALQDAYGCIEPLDIVEKIFDPGEISLIAVEIIGLAGYGSGSIQVVDDLKN